MSSIIVIFVSVIYFNKAVIILIWEYVLYVPVCFADEI